MRKLLIIGLSCLVMGSALAFSRWEPAATFIPQSERNPWNHLQFNDSADSFQFIIISDRTGGHRANIFSKAVEQINLLQPEFVLSVGDLIEGYTEDRAKLDNEWREFERFIGQLQVPFFYVPGNHDVTNPVMLQLWKDKFGRDYFHFVYKNVLFLCLNTEDGTKDRRAARIGPEQIEYARKALAENSNVRWTIIAMHKPIWNHSDVDANGWKEVEAMMLDRPYTVFCGHVHRYEKTVRHGRSYYQLATTGGGSKLRGQEYGEFDHVVWVTMKANGPVLANVMLDGILSENLVAPKTVEPGVSTASRKECLPVRGRVYVDGKPAHGAIVTFYSFDERNNRYNYVADGRVVEDGSFLMSTYTPFDGVPAGDYTVTLSWQERPTPSDRPSGPQKVPARYTDARRSLLKAAVRVGGNDLLIEVKSEETK